MVDDRLPHGVVLADYVVRDKVLEDGGSLTPAAPEGTQSSTSPHLFDAPRCRSRSSRNWMGALARRTTGPRRRDLRQNSRFLDEADASSRARSGESGSRATEGNARHRDSGVPIRGSWRVGSPTWRLSQARALDRGDVALVLRLATRDAATLQVEGPTPEASRSQTDPRGGASSGDETDRPTAAASSHVGRSRDWVVRAQREGDGS